MAKILIRMDDRLLAAVDGEAARQGLSRSEYLSRIAAQEVGARVGPGRDRVRAALRRLDRLFAESPTWGDSTEIIRAERDTR